jgi:hypothetical protein
MLCSRRAAFLRTGSIALLVAVSVTNLGFSAGPKAAFHETDLAASQFLNQRLQIWQQRLDLKDWNLHVEIVPAAGLLPKTLGNIKWDAGLKTATISVLSTRDYKLSYRQSLNDMEMTVVHELVHLTLSSLPRSEASEGSEERAVVELSTALMKLDKR